MYVADIINRQPLLDKNISRIFIDPDFQKFVAY